MFISLFTITAIISFLGALPFGIVNLTTTKITIEEGTSSALKFIFGASLIELVHAALALLFAEIIIMRIIENPIIKFSIGLLLIIIGIYFLFRNEKPSLKNKNKTKLPKLLLGMFLNLINPQAIPFWIFAITYLGNDMHMIVSAKEMSSFFLAIFIGKNLALLVFVYGSHFISTKLKLCCNIISRIMGVILLLGAIVHFIKAY